MYVPGYQIEKILGEGTMGCAYLARGASDKRRIVLKIMRLNDQAQREQLKRFMLEYKVVARITHPNVVHIEERGFGSDFAFIAMEYCAFGSLRTRIKSGVVPSDALDYLRQIAAGLGAVHEIGVVHRDLKPANILFRDPRTLVLADFGVAKDLTNASSLTANGTFLGSVYYVSPEQISRQESGPLSDLYSTGVILYQMLTGKPPFGGRTVEEIMQGHLESPVPRLPPPLAPMQPLIDGLLAKDLCDRFQSCADLMSGIAWTTQRMRLA